MKILSKLSGLILLCIAFLSSCSKSNDAPMLTGTVAGVNEPVQLVVNYDYDGDICTERITTDSAGVFVFSPQVASDCIDAWVNVAGNEFGVCLRKGKTTEMAIDGTEVSFSKDGDNADISEFYNGCRRMIVALKLKPGDEESFDNASYKAKMENATAGLQKSLESVKNKREREKFGRLLEAYKNFYEMQRMEMNGESDSEAYQNLVEAINPNADEARLSGLIDKWFFGIPVPPQYIDQIRFVDTTLVNQANKNSVYHTIVGMFLMYPPEADAINEFIEAVEPQLREAPGVREQLLEAIALKGRILQAGDEIPGDPILFYPDGTMTTLTEQLRDKVTYIDLWATWCGPCRSEIPYLEKVVERFKDNDKIQFISISIDEDREAWVSEIKKDKPAWTNLIFDLESAQQFMEAIDCHSIPRFLIIGADKRFISVKAPRPSDEDIDSVINNAIE